MTTLYLDHRGTRLSHANGALEARLPDGTVQRVPLAQLRRVVIACEADVSVGLLRQLAQARVAFTVLRGRSRADAALLWPQLGDARRRLAQRRIADDPACARRLAAVLVGLRIRGQQRLLAELRVAQPRHRLAASRAMRALGSIRRKLGEQPDVPALRGAEGAAARLYLSAWSRFLPKACAFTGRRRRPPPDPVNAALSLGYSLLHGRVLECVHATGLDAAIGVLHDPAHNRPSLACDLVEPERVAIEDFVRDVFATGALSPVDFVDDANGVLLARSGRGPFFARIEPILRDCERRTQRRLRALVRWIDRQCPPMIEVPHHDD
jgi:CRISPR-associated protein Cas1